MSKSKKIFIAQLIGFLSFALLAPILYLTIRFNLFQVTSGLQIGVWGVILFGILIAVISVLIKYYLDGMKAKYTFLKKIVQGCVKLIFPLLLILFILVWLGDNINLLVEAFYVIIPCEIVAIILNPLPKWCFENNINGLGEITDRLFHNTKEEK